MILFYAPAAMFVASMIYLAIGIWIMKDGEEA